MKTVNHVGLIILFVLLPFVHTQTASAKSVFAVAAHSGTRIKAYKITDDEIKFQENVEAENFENGATGLCVWPSLELMFVTYESSNKIAWASTKTLQRDDDDEIEVPENNLAGIVADELNSVLYVITRDTNHLYTYSYDTIEDTLVLVHPNDPEYPAREYRALEGLSNAYGLALDEDGGPPVFGIPTGLLYVADGTSTVRYYNTMTWEFEDSVDVGLSAVGLDVDGAGFLYAGGYNVHNYLMRYELAGDPNDPDTLIEKDIEAQVTDISIDRITGLLYATTRRVVDNHTGAVEVYDPAGWDASDPNEFFLDIESADDFNGPGGIAVGPTYKPPRFFVKKVDVDNPHTVGLGDYITYEIVIHAGEIDEYNVVVTDRLPWGVNFYSATPGTGEYLERPEHKYVWEIGDLDAYDPNDPSDPNTYLELTVQVNDWAEPMGELVNIVGVESDSSYSEDEERTPVECRGGDIIYVDKAADGYRTGLDWENAYTDLQDALARARKGCGNQIWVAEGTYKPSRSDIGVSFDMVADVGIYGGFKGDETERAERDWKRNETVLSGYLSSGYSNKIVKGVGYLGDAVLDGFSIEEGFIGIYCENTWDPNDLHEPVFANCTITKNTEDGIQFYDHADAFVDNCIVSKNYDGINVSDNCWPEVENCIIKNNDSKGISCNDSAILLTNSIIENNTSDGIFSYASVLDIMSCIVENNNGDGIESGEYSNCFASNNIIRLNNENGILCSTDSLSNEIYNNWIHHNGADGINFYDTIYTGDVRNNTVVYNEAYGIACDYGYKPVVVNCIVWGNGSGDIFNCNNVTYSCFDNGSSGAGNTNKDPLFAYSWPGQFNYHLSSDSPCIDEGNNNGVVTGEVDIDGDDRVYDGDGDETLTVDMGADEYTCGDVYKASDFNGDGIVNMKDFDIFSSAWLSHDPDEPGLPDPNDADNWNNLCNLENTGDSTYVIDIEDFILFVEPWLWTACWYNESIWMMSGSGGGESLLLSESLEIQSVPTLPVEKSIEEQLADAEVIVEWLEEVSKDKDFFEYIDKKLWAEFVDKIYDWLYELEDLAEIKLKE